MQLGANGTMPIRLGWRGAFFHFDITGGPFDVFRNITDEDFGVCVRAERIHDLPFDLLLAIKDFDVPDQRPWHVSLTLKDTIAAALGGRDVYVGCMGGWGRTGLFLALLAKACGEDNPVAYVREHYTPHAVETQKQASYVAAFDVTEIRQWLRRYTWALRLKRLFGIR